MLHSMDHSRCCQLNQRNRLCGRRKMCVPALNKIYLTMGLKLHSNMIYIGNILNIVGTVLLTCVNFFGLIFAKHEVLYAVFY